MERIIKRGDIYYADLSPVVGSEQGGARPVLIISNDIGNKHSPTVIVASISGKISSKAKLPTHYYIGAENGLEHPSVILLEQIRTIDKHRLKNYIGQLDKKHLDGLNHALAVSIDIIDWIPNALTMCLCPICARNFTDTGNYNLQRANPVQKEKGTCIFCNHHTGYDYMVTTRKQA